MIVWERRDIRNCSDGLGVENCFHDIYQQRNEMSPPIVILLSEARSVAM